MSYGPIMTQYKNIPKDPTAMLLWSPVPCMHCASLGVHFSNNGYQPWAQFLQDLNSTRSGSTTRSASTGDNGTYTRSHGNANWYSTTR
jgi:hypothetical protein